VGRYCGESYCGGEPTGGDGANATGRLQMQEADYACYGGALALWPETVVEQRQRRERCSSNPPEVPQMKWSELRQQQAPMKLLPP